MNDQSLSRETTWLYITLVESNKCKDADKQNSVILFVLIDPVYFTDYLFTGSVRNCNI